MERFRRLSFTTLIVSYVFMHQIIASVFVIPSWKKLNSRIGVEYLIAAEIVARIFQYWPAMVELTAAVVIFVKYRVSLEQILDNLKAVDGVDFAKMCKEYIALHYRFRNEYNQYLESSILLILAATVFSVWEDSHAILTVGNWDSYLNFIEDVLIFVLFVYFASMVGESFHKYEAALYKYGSLQLNEEKSIDWIKYQYLISYVSKYPIVIRFGRTTITRINTIKFIVVFCAAKFIAYAASDLLQ